MNPRVFILLLSSVGALTGCSRGLTPLGTVDQTIGRATLRDIMIEVPTVLRRYGYAIYNDRPTRSTLYLETGWQERAPFEDEEKAGVDYARTRFIVRARLAGPSIYTLRISAENQVRAPADRVSETTPDWSTMAPTDRYQAYVREITGEIEMRVNAGLRKYDL